MAGCSAKHIRLDIDFLGRLGEQKSKSEAANDTSLKIYFNGFITV
jgi:hypothetical protein